MQPSDLPSRKPLENKKTEADFKTALELKKPVRLVRFVHPVPKFVGPELEEYGPFDEEDIASLPAEVADVIIGKGRAEEIREE